MQFDLNKLPKGEHFKLGKKFNLFDLYWWVHIVVSIQDFHSCHTGSNPVLTTTLLCGVISYYKSKYYRILGCSVMAALETLTFSVLVRIQTSQLL